ncbi:endochitinase A [Drosophila novamexicana]|uniref:endochitinase A n=1 Tax=Drosophila novamexicana TaxID=47314 RepID=UPI0011E5B0FA|nr:endochitinase A [Drosophila novamexicana]
MLQLSLMLMLMCGLLQVQMQPVEQAAATMPEDSEGARALYDQRQTGKYNIHVSIKDVAIIEVDQNELADESYIAEDEDYYYDDSALTIKPIKFTTDASTATTTTTTAETTTTTTSTTPTTPVPVSTAAIVGIPTPSSNMSAYSAQLLADIAATQRLRPKSNNLIIMDTPIGGSSTMLPKWLHARSKDEPITTTTDAGPLPANIEYTPAQGHDSPIFKVKVQRAAPAETPARCRAHQYRDAQGKCRTKRSGSILRKLFSMLVSLPFTGNRHAHHGHGLQVSP